jgi:acyl dehydratase
MTHRFETRADLDSAVGHHLGHSAWLTIDQTRINLFAEATGDDQWIHVDPDRAADGPYGSTVAHGYLTLSLLPVLVAEVVDYAGWPAKLNYGSDRVRFPAPVPVDSRVRAGVELLAVRDVSSGLQVTSRVTVEIDGSERPALVAETITLLLLL